MKKDILKKLLPHMIPTTVMTFWKKQDYGEYKKISDCQWAEKIKYGREG